MGFALALHQDYTAPSVSISHLIHLEYACHLCVAVLILFTTAFCQSNLAPATTRAFDPTRHLLRANVRLAANHVQVLEKWSKTRQQICRDRWLAVPRVLGSPLCLHTAISALYGESPTTRRNQPLLSFHDGLPLPISDITRAFKLALTHASLSHRLTLHSLRRGGARFLQLSGVKTPDIASHGGWRLGAIFRYIDHPTKPAAFTALQALK